MVSSPVSRRTAPSRRAEMVVPVVSAARISLAPSSGLVISIWQPPRFTLSRSVIARSLSTMATEPPPTVQIVAKFAPPAPELLLASRSTTGACELPTAIWMVSVSLRASPEPVLPRSLVAKVMLAYPLYPLSGVKTNPSSAVFISAMVPVKVIVVSSVPSPIVKFRLPLPLPKVLRKTPSVSPVPTPLYTTA